MESHPASYPTGIQLRVFVNDFTFARSRASLDGSSIPRRIVGRVVGGLEEGGIGGERLKWTTRLEADVGCCPGKKIVGVVGA